MKAITLKQSISSMLVFAMACLISMSADAADVTLFEDDFTYPQCCPGTHDVDVFAIPDWGTWFNGPGDGQFKLGDPPPGPPVAQPHAAGWHTGTPGELFADFEGGTLNSGTITVSFNLWLPSSASWQHFGLRLVNGEGGGGPGCQFFSLQTASNDFGAGGDINFSETGGATGVTYNRTAWERWVIVWDLSLSEVYLSLRGEPLTFIGFNVSDLGCLASAGTGRVGFLANAPSADDGSLAWRMDDVLIEWDRPSLQQQINDLQAQIDALQLTPGPQGPQGKLGPSGQDGQDGAQGPQGKLGPAGADAPCVDCSEVASAAVDLACKLVQGATSAQELQDCADIITRTITAGANICDEANCDVGAEIQALIDAKLNP